MKMGEYNKKNEAVNGARKRQNWLSWSNSLMHILRAQDGCQNIQHSWIINLTSEDINVGYVLFTSVLKTTTEQSRLHATA